MKFMMFLNFSLYINNDKPCLSQVFIAVPDYSMAFIPLAELLIQWVSTFSKFLIHVTKLPSRMPPLTTPHYIPPG